MSHLHYRSGNQPFAEYTPMPRFLTTSALGRWTHTRAPGCCHLQHEHAPLVRTVPLNPPPSPCRQRPLQRFLVLICVPLGHHHIIIIIIPTSANRSERVLILRGTSGYNREPFGRRWRVSTAVTRASSWALNIPFDHSIIFYRAEFCSHSLVAQSMLDNAVDVHGGGSLALFYLHVFCVARQS
jgi:hypothetical protein